MDNIILGIFCYISGSIPFGFLLTRFFLNKDIRNIGSGNIGATNALRSGNKNIGYGTLFFDILKAIIPITYIKYNFPEFIFVGSLLVFLGHVFPIWLKFKGGKGVATYIGILFSIDLIYGVIFIFVWMLTFLISKYSSVSSLIATLSIPIYITIFNNGNLIFFCILFVLIFYTHKENIKRLKNKEESKTKIY